MAKAKWFDTFVVETVRAWGRSRQRVAQARANPAAIEIGEKGERYVGRLQRVAS